MSRAIYFDTYSPRQAKLRVQWNLASHKYYNKHKKLIKARRDGVV